MPEFFDPIPEDVNSLFSPRPDRGFFGKAATFARQENFDLQGFANKLAPQEPIEGYNPMVDPALAALRIPDEDRHLFQDSPNPRETVRLAEAYIDEKADREVLSTMGFWESLAPSLAASLVDPLVLAEIAVTGGVPALARQTLKQGGRLAAVRAASQTIRGRMATGAAAGLTAQTITELSLQEQRLRTEEEAILNIIASGAMTAVFGGLTGLPPHCRARMEAKVKTQMTSPDYVARSDKARANVNSRLVEIEEETGSSAALAELRKIEDEEFAKEFGNDFLKAATKISDFKLLKPVQNLMYGPSNRIAMSEFSIARRLVRNIDNQPVKRLHEEKLSGVYSLADHVRTAQRNLAGVDYEFQQVASALKKDFGIDRGASTRLVMEAARRGDRLNAIEASEIVADLTDTDVGEKLFADVQVQRLGGTITEEVLSRLRPISAGYRKSQEAIAEALTLNRGLAVDVPGIDRLGGTADSYAGRVYNSHEIAARRADFEELVRSRFGDDFDSVKFSETLDKLVDGGGLNSAGGIKALMARTLDIEDTYVSPAGNRYSDFLENDLGAVLERQIRDLRQQSGWVEANTASGVMPLAEAVDKQIQSLGKQASEFDGSLAALARFSETETQAAQRSWVAKQANKLSKNDLNDDLRKAFVRDAEHMYEATSKVSRLASEVSKLERKYILASGKREVGTAVSGVGMEAVERLSKNVLKPAHLPDGNQAKLFSQIANSRVALKEALAEEKGIRAGMNNQYPTGMPRSKWRSDLDQEGAMKVLTESYDRDLLALNAEVWENGMSGDRITAQIGNEYRERIKGLSEKDAEKLRKNKVMTEENIKILQRRVLRTIGSDQSPESAGTRATIFLKQSNLLTMLGGVLLSSIPDAALGLMAHGFQPIAKAVREQFSDLKWGPKVSKVYGGDKSAFEKDIRRFAFASETAASANSRALAYGELESSRSASNKRLTWAERMSTSAADNFGRITGLNKWNGFNRAISATATMTRIEDAISLKAAGKLDDLTKKQLFKDLGMTDNMLDRIHRSWKKHGQKDASTYGWSMANVADWSDKAAVNALEDAVSRASARALVEPTFGDLPGLFDNRFMGLLLQFKSFAFATTNRVFLQMDQMSLDRRALYAVPAMVAAGGVATALKDLAAGRDPGEREIGQWGVDAIDRSGAFGILMEVNGITEQMTGGRMGLQALTGSQTTRFRERSPGDILAGPSGGKLDDALGLFSGDAKKRIESARDMTPGQNLFYIRRILDHLEQNLINQF